MKVILLQDVKGVGKKDQTINANEGYAKNFLFPKEGSVAETSSLRLQKRSSDKHPLSPLDKEYVNL